MLIAAYSAFYAEEEIAIEASVKQYNDEHQTHCCVCGGELWRGDQHLYCHKQWLEQQLKCSLFIKIFV